MTIAETTSRTSLVLLGALALGTLAAAGVSLAAGADATTAAEASRAVRPMRGCAKAQRARVADAPPAPLADGRSYASVLRAAGDDLSACLRPQRAQLRLELTIAPTGRVRLWQVDVASGDFEGVDAEAMACLQAVVDPMRFPPSDKEVRVSTHLIPRR